VAHLFVTYGSLCAFRGNLRAAECGPNRHVSFILVGVTQSRVSLPQLQNESTRGRLGATFVRPTDRPISRARPPRATKRRGAAVAAPNNCIDRSDLQLP
jgi:hypothetical protein